MKPKALPEFAKELAKKLEIEMMSRKPEEKKAVMSSLSDIISRAADSDEMASDARDALIYSTGLNNMYWELDDDFKPIASDITKLEKTLSSDQKILAKTIWKQGVTVSSVFLGIDHSFKKGSDPILFETMIFDDMGILKDEFKDWQERNSSHEGLLRTHFEAVRLVMEQIGEPMEEFIREKPSVEKSKDHAGARAFESALKNL